MTLEEISIVMASSFWQEYMRRANEMRQAVSHRYYKDAILTQDQWIKHAKYQGELEGIDQVLLIPERIIKEIKGETR
jgi:hypothetical protein